MEICHLDGDRSNNRLDNLRYDTRKNNHADKWKHGTMARGELCGHSKLKESDILEIRRSKLSPLELARQFNVTVHNIYAILENLAACLTTLSLCFVHSLFFLIGPQVVEDRPHPKLFKRHALLQFCDGVAQLFSYDELKQELTVFAQSFF